ncbi:MAG: alternative ribosome rescue aminoacyl-tRNA hydrolase ArfB [Planctomycetota bacterium]
MNDPGNDPGHHPDGSVAPGVRLDPAALRFTFARAAGPGGQNVNKLNTAATLTVTLEDLADALPPWALARLRGLAGHRLAREPDRLVIRSSRSRSQLANRRDCLLKLRRLLIEATDRPRRRRVTRPSPAAKRRRLEDKKHRARTKDRRRPPESD